MTDLGMTIEPKSEQLNSDDLISGPITITVKKVSARQSSSEQPIAISYDGDNGKPYLPCKSMRRVLVSVWGRNGEDYVGRSMTLFRDPSVTWAGMQVGGIRISHMSHTDKPITMALTATKQTRKPYTVQPLAAIETKGKPSIDESAVIIHAKAEAEQGTDAFKAHYKKLSPDERAVLQPIIDDLKAMCEKADNPPDYEPEDEVPFE